MKSYLTQNFFAAFAGIQFLGLLLFVFPFLIWIYTGLTLLIALMGIRDFRSLAIAHDLRAEVRLPFFMELEEKDSIKVRLYSSTDKILSSSEVKLIAPALECLEFETSSQKFSFDSSGILTCELPFTAFRLGYEETSEVEILVYSAWWFWIRKIKLKIMPPTSFRVIPTREARKAKDARELELNQRLLLQGSRQLMRAQTPDQFRSIREYQFPDPPKRIDPKKSAKFRKPMSRIYESLHHQHLVIALDVGRAMMGELGASAKNEFYSAAALLTAERAIKAGDHVSLMVFSQTLHEFIRSSRSVHDFLPLFRGSRSLHPKPTESNFELIPNTLPALSGQRSVLLIFTDIWKPSVQSTLIRVLPSIAQKHLVFICSLIDQKYSLEEQIANFSDSGLDFHFEAYTHLYYSYWLRDRMEKFRLDLLSMGVGTLLATETSWLGLVENLYDRIRESVRL